MALYLMVFMGGTPLGSPFIGWIGETFGARWTLIAGGGLTILGVLVSVAVFTRGRDCSTVGWSSSRSRLGRRPSAAARLRNMNPRYRRLVIPVALGGLILIVVIAALVR